METAKLLTDGCRQTLLLPEAYRFHGNEVQKYEEPFMTERKQSLKQQERAGLDELSD